MAKNDEIATIPYIAHENAVSRLYRIIRCLVIAIIIISVAFTSYLFYDRYYDCDYADETMVLQDCSDEARNYYNNGSGFINGKAENQEESNG